MEVDYPWVTVVPYERFSKKRRTELGGKRMSL